MAAPGTLQQQIEKTGILNDLQRCIQCGTCSGSCPFAGRMDYAPRALFALIRDGEIEPALTADTPWYCSSCYQCMARCPQEIPVTDIMYQLKRMAIELNTVPAGHKMLDLYKAFADNVKQFGRATEPLVMARYGMKHPIDAMKSLPLALRLMSRKRMEFRPQQTQNRQSIKRLLDGMDKEEKHK